MKRFFPIAPPAAALALVCLNIWLPLIRPDPVTARTMPLEAILEGPHAPSNPALYNGSRKRYFVAIKAAVSGLLARSSAPAESLEVQGTPGFSTGPDLLFEAIDLLTMRQQVAEARAHPDGRFRGP